MTDQTDPPATSDPPKTEAPLAPYDAGVDPLTHMNSGALVTDDFDFAFLEEMSALGLATPVAHPTKIRRAFDMMNKMFTAVLSPSDFMYSISFSEGNKQKQLAYASLEHAQKAAEAYGNVPIKASPKKSGINRLAVATGVEAQRVKTTGLPEEPGARYSCVTYELVHKATGRKAEGIGWADLDEKGGHMSRHDAIATADTRAYNRGVLRLLGFGDVSAEEILSVGMLEGGENGMVIPDENSGQRSRGQERPQQERRREQGGGQQGGGQQQGQQPPKQEPPSMLKQLPPPTSPEVLTASMAWASALAARPIEQRSAPPAQQSNHDARTLRAAARGGDAQAAQQLGAKGLDWSGPALMNGKAFFVETAPDAARAALRAGAPAATTQSTEPKPTTTETPPQNDEPKSEEPKAESPPPSGDMTSSAMTSPPPGDTIPSAMAKNLTTKLLEKFGTIQRCKNWIKETYGVESSMHLSPTQYADALERIKNMKTEG